MDDGPRPEVVFPAAIVSFFVLCIVLKFCCWYASKLRREKHIQQMSQAGNQNTQYMACNNAFPYGQPPVMENRTLQQVHPPPGVTPGRVISPFYQQLPQPPPLPNQLPPSALYQQLPPSAPPVDAGFSNLQELPNDPPPRYEELPPKQGFGLLSQQLQQQQPPYPVANKYQ